MKKEAERLNALPYMPGNMPVDKGMESRMREIHKSGSFKELIKRMRVGHKKTANTTKTFYK